MRIVISFLFALIVMAGGGCTHSQPGNTNVVSGVDLTATGMLQKQGFTTYMYGTHILIVNATTTYVLESTTIDLDPFVGRQVKLTAVNTHYHVENGPEMYNVTWIQAL